MNGRTRNLSLDLITRSFVQEADGGPQPHELPLDRARQSLRDLQSAAIAKPDADTIDRTIEAGPPGRVSFRIVRPRGLSGDLPAVMYFHGGGWALGDKDTHDRIVRELAVRTGAAVVFVDYDRSPEARYPVAVEQAYAATRWVSEKGHAVSIDGSRLAVAPDGSGGNLAATVALLANGHRKPKLAFQLLLFQALDATMNTPPRTTNTKRARSSPAPRWSGSGTPTHQIPRCETGRSSHPCVHRPNNFAACPRPW